MARLTNAEKLTALSALSALAKVEEQALKADVKVEMLDDGEGELEVRIGKKKVATIYSHIERSLRVDVMLEDTPQKVWNRFVEDGATIEELLGNGEE